MAQFTVVSRDGDQYESNGRVRWISQPGMPTAGVGADSRLACAS